ncbi:MAG: radical SAM protein [Spirochaetia bacterium]|jgi:radical SAM superfamily enzyme YgiQ (UPF0313 family)
MKILLVDPCKNASNVNRSRGVTRFPQISLRYISACTPPSHEVEIVEEEVRPIDFDADCDLVGITCMTANAPRAYVVADEFRRRGKRVVLGGVHPTVRPEEAARHADAVVVGEAEPVWAGLLGDAEEGRMRNTYRSNTDWSLDDYPLPSRTPDCARSMAEQPGQEDAMRQAERRPLMDALLRPALDGVLWPTLDAIQRAAQGVKQWPILEALSRPAFGVVPVVTSRGCPYACEFCCVRNMFGRAIRHVSVPRVMEDIERSGSRRVMFLDDNIVGDQNYAERLFDALRGRGIQWVGQASISFVRNERLLEKAAASGCRGLFIGLESVVERKVERMQKGMKTLEATAAAIRRITRAGILFHASIVFGFDDDDPSVFDATLEFLAATRIASATFNILTPYPGTVLFDQYKSEGRLLSEDWKDFDHCTPTFIPRHMSLEQLIEGYQRVRETFYGLGSIALRMPANWRTPLLFSLANLGLRASIRGDRAVRSVPGLALSSARSA